MKICPSGWRWWTLAVACILLLIAIVAVNYASAHPFFSILLMTSGRQAEALDEIRRAQEFDPLSLIVNDVAGWIYYEGRQ
jgi:hypothetical protein